MKNIILETADLDANGYLNSINDRELYLTDDGIGIVTGGNDFELCDSVESAVDMISLMTSENSDDTPESVANAIYEAVKNENEDTADWAKGLMDIAIREM